MKFYYLLKSNVINKNILITFIWSVLNLTRKTDTLISLKFTNYIFNRKRSTRTFSAKKLLQGDESNKVNVFIKKNKNMFKREN